MAVKAAPLAGRPHPVTTPDQQPTLDGLNEMDVYEINLPHRRGRFRVLDTYETNLAVQLRLRFFELHDTFRIVREQPGGDANFEGYAEKLISAMFKSAQTALRQSDADLLGVSHLLDAIHCYMVWLLPKYTLRYAIINTLTELQALPILGKEKYVEELTQRVDKWEATSVTKPAGINQAAHLRSARIALYEMRGAISTYARQEQINNRLQIRRLGGLWWWGVMALAIFFVISPLVTNLAIFRGTANE